MEFPIKKRKTNKLRYCITAADLFAYGAILEKILGVGRSIIW